MGHFTTNPQARSYYDPCALLKMQIGCNYTWHVVNFDSVAHCIFHTAFMNWMTETSTVLFCFVLNSWFSW